jgi:hypothetical protein
MDWEEVWENEGTQNVACAEDEPNCTAYGRQARLTVNFAAS